MDVQDLAAKGVKAALAAGADDAECWVEQGTSLDVDIEQNRISGSSLGNSAGGTLRVLVDGRLGFAYFTAPERLDAAAAQAVKLSALAPQRPFAFPDSQAYPSLPARFDDDIASLSTDAALAMAKDLVQGALEAAPGGMVAGGIGMGWGEAAIANASGLSGYDKVTSLSAMASIVLPDGESSINAWDSATRHVGDVEAYAIGNRAGTTAMSLRDPKPAATGRADVILRPGAAAELVAGLVGQAMDGDEALRGKSFWSGKGGEAVGHPGLTIVDDPLHPEAIGASPFDGEGAASRTNPLLDDGVLGPWLFDSRDAARHGREPTASCVRDSFKAAPSTGTRHMIVSCKDTRPEAKLLADIDSGYLVESVLGAHTANGTTGDFSVTAANAWRVQGGEIIGACDDIAIGGNLPSLLVRLDAASKEVRRFEGARIPSLRIGDVQVSA